MVGCFLIKKRPTMFDRVGLLSVLSSFILFATTLYPLSIEKNHIGIILFRRS